MDNHHTKAAAMVRRADVRYNEILRWEDRATQGCDPSAPRRPEAEVSRRPVCRRDASSFDVNSWEGLPACPTIPTSAFGPKAINPTVKFPIDFPPSAGSSQDSRHPKPPLRPPRRAQVRLSGIIHRVFDRGKETRLSSRAPSPPNRTCGSPASGSPVDSFTSERIDRPGHGPFSS